jgi:hypothetical protein
MEIKELKAIKKFSTKFNKILQVENGGQKERYLNITLSSHQ